MVNFRMESNPQIMNDESSSVLLGKENIETQYKLYTDANDILKSKWKGSASLLYQRYCGYMQTAVNKAIAASGMFAGNIQTFSQKKQGN